MADTISNLQRIDACRPRHDDWRASEMAELAAALASDPQLRAQFERSQLFDAALTEAVHDVPVPAGLADRVLSAVRHQAHQINSGQSESQRPESQRPESQRPESQRPESQRPESQRPESQRAGAQPADSSPGPSARRRWRPTRVVLVLATALSLLVAGSVTWWYGSRGPVLTEAELNSAALTWLAQQSTDINGFRVLEEHVFYSHPSDGRVDFYPIVWQPLETKIGEALVYQDDPGEDPNQHHRAYMFVIRTARKTNLPNSPPTRCSDTAGWCIGCWQVGDRVYVLAVEGDKDRYQNYLPALDVA